MSDITIPDAAVEAASKASYDHLRAEDDGVIETPWEEYRDKGWWRDVIRVELTAAAPHIAAQALRDAAQAWQINGWADALPHGSDRPSIIIGMAQRSADWLRARADRIEAGRG